MTPPREGLPPERLPPGSHERVVEILKRHFANDTLSDEELDARLERAYAATTAGELEALLDDLPALAASDALPVPAEAAAINAVFAGQERRITGLVPRRLVLRARGGYVELDLTHAAFQPGLTTIDVRALVGYVQIRLPAHVRVESEGRALFGYFSLHGAGREAAGSPDAESVVRVGGRAILGFAESFVRSEGPEPSPR